MENFFLRIPKLSIGAGFDLGLSYYLDYVNLSSSTSFINHILGIRGLLTMTTKTSLSAYIQYNTAIDKVVTNIRFRYNPREGNDFYIVYDEGINSDLATGNSRVAVFIRQNLLLKYTYTFIF